MDREQRQQIADVICEEWANLIGSDLESNIIYARLLEDGTDLDQYELLQFLDVLEGSNLIRYRQKGLGN